MRNPILSTVLAAVMLFLSCRDAPLVELLPAEPPLGKVLLVDEKAVLQLEPGAQIEDFVDLSVFCLITPEMTVSEVEELLEEPLARGRFGRNEARFVRCDQGLVGWVKKNRASEGDVQWDWELYAIPTDLTLQSMVDAKLLSQVPDVNMFRRLRVITDNGRSGVTIRVERSGKVHSIYWGRLR